MNNANIDVSNVVLETERLILRAFTYSDLEEFYEYASVKGVGEWAGWTYHKDISESLKILELFIKEKKTFAIFHKKDKKVIGSIGIELCKHSLGKDFDKLKGRELGNVLSKNYWGQGIMTEAMKKVISYCFQELNYDFLCATYFEENFRSKRVLEKTGFKFFKNLGKIERMNLIKNNILLILKNKKSCNY